MVDDEATIRDLLSGSLRFAGFEVVMAASGAEAVRAAARSRPDLILLDVMMPDGDGFEVARRLCADRGGIPVVFLTARDEVADRLLRFLMANAGRVLSKAQIRDNVWDYPPAGDGNLVESCVSCLRSKIDQREPRLIHTIRGYGYVLRIPA